MKKTHTLRIGFWITIATSVVPGFAFAKDIPLQVSIALGGKDTFANVAEYIGAVYQYLTGIAGILAIAMIMYAGLKWIFAAGDQGKIGAAQETIRNAVIGLVLTLGSYLLLNTINPALVHLKVPIITNVAQILELNNAAWCTENTKDFPCGEKISNTDPKKGGVGFCRGMYCDKGPGGADQGCYFNGTTFSCFAPGLCPSDCASINKVAKDIADKDKLDAKQLLELTKTLCLSPVCLTNIPAGCWLKDSAKGDCTVPGYVHSDCTCVDRIKDGAGVTCKTDLQCETGFFCNTAEFQPSCKPKKGLTVGQWCDKDDQCTSGSTCNAGYLKNKCSPIGGEKEGDPCKRDKDCQQGLICLANLARRCIKPKSLGKGERCFGRNDACTSGSCTFSGKNLADTCD